MASVRGLFVVALRARGLVTKPMQEAVMSSAFRRALSAPAATNGQSSTASPQQHAPRLEVELHKVVVELSKLKARTPAERSEALVSLIYPAFERLVEAAIKERLEDSSDLRYDAYLAKTLLPSENFNDLLDGSANEYVLRKHLQAVLRAYVSTVDAARRINVTDEVKFGLQMERLGLQVFNVGFQARSAADRKATELDGTVKGLLYLSGFAISALLIAYLYK